MLNESPPISSRCFTTTLIPIQETVSWKIHNVSDLIRTKAWTALVIPMEVGLGPTELSRWNVSLQSRNNNTLLCARLMLLSPQEQHRRVTHHLKVAVFGGGDGSSVYYFPNPTNSNSTTNTSNNPTSANIIAPTTSNESNRCFSMRKLRRLFSKNAKLDDDEDELGDGTSTKEVRPGHKGHPSLWKVAPLDKIIPNEEDCIELRLTLTVYGCDIMEDR